MFIYNIIRFFFRLTNGMVLGHVLYNTRNHNLLTSIYFILSDNPTVRIHILFCIPSHCIYALMQIVTVRFLVINYNILLLCLNKIATTNPCKNNNGGCGVNVLCLLRLGGKAACHCPHMMKLTANQTHCECR